MTASTTEAALRELVRQSLTVGAPGLAEPIREAIVRSIVLKAAGKVLAPLLADRDRLSAALATARAEGEALRARGERAEAVLRKHVSFDLNDDDAGITCAVIGLRAAAAEIASLRSQDREDGARWMRERAAEVAETVWQWIALDRSAETVGAIAEQIRALPLRPAQEADDA